VLLYVGIIEHYLALRSAATACTSSGAPQWSAAVLLAAGAAEGLSNLAFSVGVPAFEAHIKEVKL
jgi:hypothetical protein